MEAMEASKPTALIYGKVSGVDPLEVTINPSLILPASVLKVARQVTDYETSVTLLPPKKEGELPWVTEKRGGGSGDPAFEEHDHDIQGKHHVMIHNKLEIGDECILVRLSGGQKYVIIDKVGEW